MKVTARATRSQGWWVIEVPEVDGAFTQARRLDQVPAMVLDAVALLEDVPDDSIEVDVQPQLDEELTAVMAFAKAQRAESERLARSASDLLASIAKQLSVEQELSLRDAGVILGVSHQRVAQILESSTPSEPVLEACLGLGTEQSSVAPDSVPAWMLSDRRSSPG